MSSQSFAATEFVVRTIAQTSCDNEKRFGDLDAVVGDGDFGYSLARGFEVILADWDSYDRSDIGTFLQKIAIAITNRIGGTSGPIWGTAFLRAGGKLKGHDEISGAEVITALRAAAEGIQARGGAALGDKTLLDALVPATDVLETKLTEGVSAAEALEASAIAAEAAAEATTSMQAMRGRAAYTGERSIGSVDPGAVAVAVIFRRLSDEWTSR
ncbi:MAG: dihydroxyacetone kinase subunit DhaL [Microbacteriaceae bacterium]